VPTKQKLNIIQPNPFIRSISFRILKPINLARSIAVQEYKREGASLGLTAP
jgi:hypothetical protein